MSRARLGGASTVLICLALAGPWYVQDLAAQEGGLERVERLVRSGYAEEARVALLAWWDGGWAAASRADAQSALWLRARLTVDPREAELDFRRLVIEYPGGLFSDDALLRLVQSAHATGDTAAARGHLEALSRDYPESVATGAARSWLQGAGSPLSRVQSGGLAERPEGVSPGRIAGAVPPAPSRPTPAADSEGNFAVQIGAFAGSAGASSVRDRARELGVEARLVRVPGSRLIHVRVGRFDSVEAVRDFLAAVELLGFAATLVQDADREEEIGR